MLKQAIRAGLPIDPTAVEQAAQRRAIGAASSGGPRYDLVKNDFRKVLPGDRVHASVTFRRDPARCNNPPPDCPVVDDEGIEVGRFRHEVIV